MKKIFTITSFLLFIINALAQQIPDNKIDSLLINIDKSTLTSNILYERVFSWAGLATFNDSLNVSNTSHFEQALNELYQASNREKFVSYKDYRSIYTDKKNYNTVDLGIINANFHQLNYIEEDEQEGALKIVDDKFEKIDNGKPIFIPNEVLIISPLKQYLIGENITYHFDNFFLIEENEYRSINNIVANFDTSNDYLIFENGNFTIQNLEINYSETGYKTLTFIVSFNDGSTKTTQAIIHSKQAALPPPADIDHRPPFTSTIPFQGYNESSPIFGELEWRIFYADNNSQNKLLKPIIIIDGFDPLDHRKIQDSDPHPDSTDEEHNSIEEMMIYVDSDGVFVPIINLLNVNGYDVIIVNHPVYSNGSTNGIEIDGGADYIERNALNHVSLYQLINGELVTNGSNEELVIVGPSMGGQISRYALAYMEANNITHNMRLWVSVDSPHLGANIPIGTQSLLNMIAFTGNVQAEDFVEEQLGSPAAKQQLIEQCHGAIPQLFEGSFYLTLKQDYLDSRTITQGYSENKGHPFFIQYYNDLYNIGLTNSNGYPQNLRKIALVNGALLNTKSFKNPYASDWYNQIGVPYDDNFASNSEKVLGVTGIKNIFGVQIVGARIHSYFNSNNNGVPNKISRFYRRSGPSYNVLNYVMNFNSRGNMDNTPGGWFPTNQILAKSIIENIPSELSWYELRKIKHVNSFIPTVSALGFKNPNFNWSQELNRNLVCTDEIPFDSYFGPRNNERHTSFTEENVNWLLEELDGNTQSPTVYLDANDMVGPDIICSGDIVTYDFGTCKVGTPVQNWVVTNGLQIISSNGSSVTIESATSTNNPGFIKAVFPTYTVHKDIWLGKPHPPSYLNGPEIVSTGAIVTYSGDVAEGATSYKWWLPYPYDIVSPIDLFNDHWQTYPNMGRNNSYVFTGYGQYSGLVQLAGVNSCGEGSANMIYVEHGSGGGGDPPIPVVPYPNSADTGFNLDFSTYPEGTYYI